MQNFVSNLCSTTYVFFFFSRLLLGKSFHTGLTMQKPGFTVGSPKSQIPSINNDRLIVDYVT